MSHDVLTTERAILRLAEEHEAKLVLDYFVRNRAHLAPWEPAPPTGFYTEAFWLERLAHSGASARPARARASTCSRSRAAA